MSEIYEIKNLTNEECRIYDRYELNLFFGLFQIRKIGCISLMSLFGFEFYHRIDIKSVLFGVNWNG